LLQIIRLVKEPSSKYRRSSTKNRSSAKRTAQSTPSGKDTKTSPRGHADRSQNDQRSANKGKQERMEKDKGHDKSQSNPENPQNVSSTPRNPTTVEGWWRRWNLPQQYFVAFLRTGVEHIDDIQVCVLLTLFHLRSVFVIECLIDSHSCCH